MVRTQPTAGGGGGTASEAIDRTPVRIGFLYFKYEQPEINVTAQANTVEHKTINDKIVVQQLGQQASQISIKAIVSEYETYLVDLLPQLGVVSLRSDRWSGDVIVKSTDTTFMRAVDDDNAWLHRANITCLEVERTF